jgi:hypothetical protein
MPTAAATPTRSAPNPVARAAAGGHLAKPGQPRTKWAPQFVVLLVAATVLGVSAGGVAWASGWLIAVHSGSSGESQSQPLPATPTGVSAACTASNQNTIQVSWSSVTNASSYQLYDSTSSSSGPYVSIANPTGSPYTTASLSNGTYWFEVAAQIGSNWVGANSSATTSHTISGSGAHHVCA